MLLDDNINADTLDKNGSTLLHNFADKFKLKIPATKKTTEQSGAAEAVTLDVATVEKEKEQPCDPKIPIHRRIIYKLLAKGVKINARNRIGFTAFTYAARNYHSPPYDTGFRDVVSCLLLLKADPNIGNKHNDFIPIITFVHLDMVDMASLLINNGASVHIKDSKGATPILYSNSLPMLKLLLENKALPSAKDSKENTALHKCGTEVTRELIEMGLEVDVKNQEGITPLGQAVSENNIEKCKILLEMRANPNVKTYQYECCLQNAVVVSNKELVSLLLLHRADIHAKVSIYHSILKKAIRFTNIDQFGTFNEIAQYLVEQGAKVYETQEKNSSALTMALVSRNKNASNLICGLIDKAKDLPNSTHHSLALHSSVEYYDPLRTNILISCNYEVDLQETSTGKTILHKAVSRKQHELIPVLLINGANIHTQDKLGNSPFDLALARKDSIALLMMNVMQLQNYSLLSYGYMQYLANLLENWIIDYYIENKEIAENVAIGNLSCFLYDGLYNERKLKNFCYNILGTISRTIFQQHEKELQEIQKILNDSEALAIAKGIKPYPDMDRRKKLLDYFEKRYRDGEIDLSKFERNCWEVSEAEKAVKDANAAKAAKAAKTERTLSELDLNQKSEAGGQPESGGHTETGENPIISREELKHWLFYMMHACVKSLFTTPRIESICLRPYIDVAFFEDRERCYDDGKPMLVLPDIVPKDAALIIISYLAGICTDSDFPNCQIRKLEKDRFGSERTAQVLSARLEYLNQKLNTLGGFKTMLEAQKSPLGILYEEFGKKPEPEPESSCSESDIIKSKKFT